MQKYTFAGIDMCGLSRRELACERLLQMNATLEVVDCIYIYTYKSYIQVYYLLFTTERNN